MCSASLFARGRFDMTRGRFDMTGVRAMLVIFLALVGTGCQAIGTIFEAGMWVGVIAVLLVLAVVGGLVAMLRRPPAP
jgi:hypothetical protein